MNHSLKENLITTKDASELSGYTSDYLARLVRSGEIQGKRIGHSWVISSASLETFMTKQKGRKLDRARELASSRVREYNRHNQFVHRTTRALTEKISVSKFRLEEVSLRSHSLALGVALVVVALGAVGANAAVLPHIAQRASALATEISSGFVDTFGDVPTHIAMRMEEAHVAVRADATRNILASRRAGYVVSPVLASIDLETLRTALAKEYRAPRVVSGVALSSHATAPILTVTDVYASVISAYEFFANPSNIGTTLTDAYFAIGTDAYAAIDASFSAYRALIDDSGVATLAVAATTRDALARTPHLVAQVNLALGEAVINATHAAIRTDVIAAHGLAAAAPESARIAVTLMGTAGDRIARAAEQAPARIAGVYLGATAVPATLAPRLAQAVFNAEYAAADRFVSATNAVSWHYLALVEGTGGVAYESSTSARSVAQSVSRAVASAPAALEDIALGTLGKSATALDSVTHLSSFAAVLPALSASEKTALAVYEAIHSAFDSANRTLVAFFTTTPETVLPTGVPKARVIAVATSTRPVSSGTQPVTTLSYPTYTTVVRGVSEDFVNQSLASLRTNVLATVAGMIQPVSSQVVQNITTIQQLNRIDSLHDLVVQNGDFRNSIFDNGIRVNARDGYFDNLTAGTTTLATTTVNGTLTISSLTLTGSLSSPGSITGSYFVSTSTNATSTFAGSINVDNAGFVYATSTRNVGIGVLSPAALLAVQNSTSTQPIFVASNAAGAEVYRLTNDGFVGIGTTSPTYNLAVEGSSSLGNNAIAGYFTATTTTATSTFAGSFTVGTDKLVVNSTTGNIGIGTTTPSSLVDAVSGVSLFRFSSGASNITPSMMVANTGSNGKAAALVAGTMGSAFNFDSAGFFVIAAEPHSAFVGNSLGTAAYQMRVNAAGQVGIGNNYAPTALLDISTSSPSGYTNALKIAAKNSDDLGTGLGLAFFSSIADGIATYNSGRIVSAFDTANYTGGRMTFQTPTGAGTFTDVLSLKNGGVGIGTTTPLNAKLDIRESATEAYGIKLTNRNASRTWGLATDVGAVGDNKFGIFDVTSGGARLTIDTNGRVGIGTSSPSGTLAVSGDFFLTGSTTITGADSGIVFTGSGNHDITASAGTLRIGSNTVIGNIEALNDTVDIGTAVTRFDKIYANEINASTVVGTLTGGNLTAETFTINSDNATADTENAYLAFERGTITPNATLSWNAAENAKRFELNHPLFIQNASASTTLTTFDLKSVAGQTADILRVASSSSDTLFNVTASGNVGISSTTPWGLLSVNPSGITGPTFVIGSSTATNFIVTNGGNVGVGTSVPGANLETFGGINALPSTSGSANEAGIRVRGGGNSVSLDFGSKNAGPASSWIQSRSATDYSTNYNLLLNPNGGNIGIGMTGSPGTLRGGWNMASVGTALQVNGVGSKDALMVLSAGASRFGRLAFENLLGTVGNRVVEFVHQADALNLVSENESTGAAVNNLMTWNTNTGNVGIGTTSPATSLDIYKNTSGSLLNLTGGTAQTNMTLLGKGSRSWSLLVDGSTGGAPGNFSLYDNTAAAYRFAINTSGNVGIGTTSPTTLLSLSQTTGPIITLENRNTALAAGEQIGGLSFTANDSSGGGTGEMAKLIAYTQAISSAFGNLGFYTRDRVGVDSLSEKMTIQYNGNVGIGTTSPYQKLSVAGNVIADTFIATSTTATSTFAGGFAVETNGLVYDYSSNNVGIGTASPSYKLDVAGQLRATGVDSTFGDNANARTSLHINANTGALAELAYESVGSLRWKVGKNSTTESGSNVGSDFYFNRRSDTGTDLGTAMLIQRSTGNLGIGTTTPFSRLTVVQGASGALYPSNAQALFEYSANGGIAVATPDASAAGLYFPKSTDAFYSGIERSVSTLNFRNNGATKMVIDSTGNVGIGTTTPGGLLDVFNSALTTYAASVISTSVASFATVNSANTNGQTSTLRLRASSNGGSVAGVAGISAIQTDWTANSADIAFQTNNLGTLAERMRISSAGNVGIGTSSPSDQLSLGVTGSGALTLSQNSNGAFIGTRYASAASDVLRFGTGYTERMRIDATGNVGIGTTSSWGKFSVTNTGTGPSFVVDDSTSPDTTPFIIDASGNVGIGTTTPGQKLEVNGNIITTDNSQWFGQGSVGYFGSGTVISGGASTDTALRTSGNLLFSSGASGITERMRIDTNGNVGIGTTSPWGKLSVTNTGTGPSFVVEDSTSPDTTPFVIDASGNVGIGSTSPSKKLSIDITSNGTSGTASLDGLIIHDTTNGAGWDTVNPFASVMFSSADASAGSGAGIRGAIGLVAETTINADSRLSFFSAPGAGTLVERMAIARLGNVGIGTSSPASLLSLAATSATELRLDSTNSNSYSLIRLTEGGSLSSGGFVEYTNSNFSTANRRNYLELGSASASGGITFWAANIEKMRLDSSGNLGIGTTTPTEKLYIGSGGGTPVGTATPDAISLGNTYSTTAGSNLKLKVFESGSSRYGLGVSSLSFDIVAGQTSSGINFYTNAASTPKMTIASTGNVGIGVTAPAIRLSVMDSSSQTAYTTSSSTVANPFVVQTTEAAAGSGYASLQRFYGGLGNSIWYQGLVDNGVAFGGSYVFGNRTGSAAYQEQLRITNNGNLGIGTSTPGAKLDVYGGTTQGIHVNTTNESPYALLINNNTYGTANSSGFGFYQDNNGTGRIWNNNSSAIAIGTTGNVGIGTTSPSNLLHVQKDQSAATRVQITNENTGVSSQAGLYVTNSATANYYLTAGLMGTGFTTSGLFEQNKGVIAVGSQIDGLNIFTQKATAPIIFGTGGATAASERMRITETGSVGIGTTTPLDILDIYSAVTNRVFLQASTSSGYAEYGLSADQGRGSRSTLIQYGSAHATLPNALQLLNFNNADLALGTNNTRRVTISGSGLVGIGTTSPNNNLHVYSTTNAGGITIDGTTNPALTLKANNVAKGFLGVATANDAYITGVVADDIVMRPNAAAGRMVFGSASTLLPILTLSPSGYVGIGTNSPNSIFNTVGATSTVYSAAAFTQANTYVYTPYPHEVMIKNSQSGVQGSFSGLMFYAGDAAPGTSISTARISAIQNGTASADLAFWTRQSGEALRIAGSNGNVGIGTTSPTEKLVTAGTGFTYNRVDTTGTAHIAGSYFTTPTTEFDLMSFGGYSTSRFGIPTVGYSAAYAVTGGLMLGTYGASDVIIGSNNTDRIHILSTGNVGIGTTSPAGTLQLGGSAPHFLIGTGADVLAGGQAGLLISNGTEKVISGVQSSLGFIGTYSNTKFGLATNNSTKVTIDTTGYVGIGTTSPADTLDVNGGVRVMGQGTLGFGAGMEFSYNSTTGGGITTYDRTGSAFKDLNANALSYHFLTSSAEKVTILNSGYVGIGTTTPIGTLHVTSAVGSAPSNVMVPQLILDSTTASAVGVGPSVVFKGNTGNATAHYNFAAIQGAKDSAVADNYGGYLSFHTQNSSGSTAVTERMRIDSSGNVGIGTTSPAYLLSVAGNTNSTLPVAIYNSNSGASAYTAISLYSDNTNPVTIGTGSSGTSLSNSLFMNTNGGTRMVITSTGNVGIGSTTPVSKLSVAGTGDITAEIQTTSVTNAAGIKLTGGTQAWGLYSMGSSGIKSGALGFYDYGSSVYRVVLDNAGNFGIGTTSPWGQLSVNPNGITGPSFVIGSSTATNFIVTNGGNVGIGTASPGGPLHVQTNSSSRTLGLINNSSNVSSIRFVQNGSADTSFTYLQGDGRSSGYLNIFTNDTERMRIDASGNVGIGTSTPYSKLSVWGANTTSGVNMFELTNSASTTLLSMDNAGNLNVPVATATTTLGGGLNVNSGGLVYDLTTGVTSAANLSLGATTFDTDAGVVQWVDMPVTSASAAGTVESYTASLNANPLLTVYGLADGIGGMTNLGVGIGSTSPWATLSVSTAAQQSGLLPLFQVASTTNAGLFTVNGNGNVGIGTTSPNALLTIRSASGSGADIKTDHPGTADYSGVYFQEGGTSKAFIQHFGSTRDTGARANNLEIGTLSTNAIQFRPNDTAAMTIINGGNIGIGTTSPFAKLAIQATAGGSTPLFTVASSTSGAATSTAFYVAGNGNVGIGTIAPGEKLQVAGAIRATGALAAWTANSSSISQEAAGTYISSAGPDVSTRGSINFYLVGSAGGGTPLIAMKVANTGNVGIGTTSPATLFEVGGSTANVTLDGYLNCTGFTSNANGLLACTASDERLKQNVVALDGASALAGLNALNPVSFYWNPATERGSAQQYGLIAQQVQTVFPNLVATSSPTSLTPDGTLSVNYEGLISPMVMAIQELDARTTFISNAATSTVLTVNAAGNVGIGTTTPNHTLSVAGDIGAIAFVNTSTRSAKTDIDYATASSSEDRLSQLVNLKVATYRYTIEDQNDPLRLGLIAEDTQTIAPEILSADGKGVDIYELATFTLSGVQALAAKVNAQETRMASLEDRINALESGAVSSASGSPITFSTSSLASALEGFGVLIRNGIAQFNTLVFRQLVASRDADGTSSAGSVTIIGGNTIAQVTNSLVQPSTKVFVTFNSSVTGSWWVSDKTNGSFRVVLSEPQSGDVSFDYFLVQTEGQIATSTPAVSSGTSSSGSGLDTTAPVITLLGDNPLHLSVGGTFVEPGVTVTDNADASVPYITFVNGIEMEATAGSIDTSVQTTYIITYSATDTRGNLATATRSVIIGSATAPSDIGSTPPVSADTTAPVVTLTGEAAMQLTVGDTFTDSGATATDDTDGTLTSSIVVSGSVDTATEGLYTLTYTATDAAGNSGSVSRVVTVVAAAAPAPAPAI